MTRPKLGTPSERRAVAAYARRIRSYVEHPSVLNKPLAQVISNRLANMIRARRMCVLSPELSGLDKEYR